MLDKINTIKNYSTKVKPWAFWLTTSLAIFGFIFLILSYSYNIRMVQKCSAGYGEYSDCLYQVNKVYDKGNSTLKRYIASTIKNDGYISQIEYNTIVEKSKTENEREWEKYLTDKMTGNVASVTEN